jgi:hypothetical protein
MLSKSGQSPLLNVSETGLEVSTTNILDIANKYKMMDHNLSKTTN